MKFIPIVAILASMAGSAGTKRPAATQFPVSVCMATPSTGPEFGAARMISARIFGRIDVKLDWHRGAYCPPGSIHVSFLAHTPRDLKPGALAYIAPPDSAQIIVLLDRVRATESEERMPIVLAHVIAHEIAHVLEGFPRHSASGLMKAHWGPRDFRTMARGELTFAREDIELIHRGVARRAALLAAPSGR